jgi:transposase, IS5 family
MVGLLIPKPLENLSDEVVVLQWKHNPYYQAFCCMKEFQRRLPFNSAELLHFRKRIGVEVLNEFSRRVLGCMARWRWKMRFFLTPRYRKKHHLSDRQKACNQSH